MTDLFDKMQIAVVGRENDAGSDGGVSEDEQSEGSEDDDQFEEQINDPNINSLRHKKQTTMEERA